MTRSKALISLAATLALATQTALPPMVSADNEQNQDRTQDKSKSKGKSKPSGTVLLPLTPKIDDGNLYATPAPTPAATAPASLSAVRSASSASVKSSRTAAKSSVRSIASHSTAIDTKTVSKPTLGTVLVPTSSQPAPSSPPAAGVFTTPPQTAASLMGASGMAAPLLSTGQAMTPSISPEMGKDDADAIDENSLLKGTVQIVADDTEFDQEKNTFLGTGNAVAIIAGQNSKLEADTILYDQNSGTLDARGNVKIIREGQLTTGESLKFNLDSDEYLITNPDTELGGTTVVARTARGNTKGLAFRNGDFSLPQPLHIMNNAYYGGLSSSERVGEIQAHPDAYVPINPSYKFKAHKMVYEKYKDEGQLTVFGGRLAFKNFTLPVGNFVANVGGENTRVTLPITAVIGNNMQVGGTNIGPQFNYAVGKTGAFSWAPLLQIGGNSINADGTSQSNGSKPGLGAKISYSSDRLSAHLGYGSVSKVLVADLKYRFTKKTMFQSGINRFLNDGMFGMRRAGKIAEFVDQRGITTIPYIGYLSFRSSAGWAQDNPALLGLSSNNYNKLFNTHGTATTSAFRLQEQIMANTHPLIKVGNAKYGADLTFTAGVAARAYSTGDSMLLGQTGPMITTKLNRLRMRFGYAQSAVSGKSPFVFDQFIQGNQSVYMQGDVKVCKWLTVGTNLGYNLNSKLMYTRAITAAVGPDDFKLMFTDDTITGYQRFGFDILYGQKIPFDKLVVKGGPDAGRLGGN